MTGLLMLAPENIATALLPLFVVLAGLAVIVGMKRVAAGLMMTVAVVIFAPVLLGPLLEALLGAIPEALFWPVLLVGGAVVVLLVLHTLVAAIFGRGTADNLLGILLADGLKLIAKLTILGPMRLCSLGVRLVTAPVVRQALHAAVRTLTGK